MSHETNTVNRDRAERIIALLPEFNLRYYKLRGLLERATRIGTVNDAELGLAKSDLEGVIKVMTEYPGQSHDELEDRPETMAE